MFILDLLPVRPRAPPQRGPRTVQARRHRPDRHAEDLSGRAIVEALRVDQDDGRAVLRREFRHCRGEPGA
jgi:hypothetical protein